MNEDDILPMNPDDILVRVSDIYACITAIFLIARGQAPRKPEEHREYLADWVRRQVSPELWRDTLAEIQAIPPERRGAVIDAFMVPGRRGQSRLRRALEQCRH